MKTFAGMALVSGANGGFEKVVEHWGKHWILGPVVEAIDFYHVVYENLKTDDEIDEEIEALRERMGCK